MEDMYRRDTIQSFNWLQGYLSATVIYYDQESSDSRQIIQLQV